MRHGLTLILAVAWPAFAADYYSNRQEVASQALLYAELSDLAYSDKMETQDGEWLRYRTSGLPNSPQTGFYAATYINNKTGERVVAFRGSDDGKDWTDTNIPQATLKTGQPPKQFQQAVAYVQQTQQMCQCEVSVTGHSLGGALAQYAAGQLALKAYTFNPAGLGEPARKRILDDSRVTNLIVAGDMARVGTHTIGQDVKFDLGRALDRTVTGVIGTSQKEPVKALLPGTSAKHDMGLFIRDLREISKGSTEPYSLRRKTAEAAKTAVHKLDESMKKGAIRAEAQRKKRAEAAKAKRKEAAKSRERRKKEKIDERLSQEKAPNKHKPGEVIERRCDKVGKCQTLHW